MAAERIGELIPDAEWRPIYAFALFKLNGRTPWVLTDERPARLREIQERAAGYGLPPIRWPQGLPERNIDLVRAATVAKHEGREEDFALATFRAIFLEGGDPSRPDALRRVASQAGLDPDAVLARIGEQDVKDEVRAAIDEAHARGVPGVPTVTVGDEVFWGDDRLDEAAAAAGH